jgi:hypothetical protein
MSVFPTNVEIQKTFPAVKYEPNNPTLEPAGVWHEDHEIDGAMYRAANAMYTESTKKWSFVTSGQAAYALVQNTDGSTSYLHMPANAPSPWLTSAWQGTGQPLVYHAVNYGMSTSNVDNTAALTAAIYAAGVNGGLVLIPPGQYNFTGTVDLDTTLSVNPFPGQSVIIAGYGSSTELIQTTDADLFSINEVDSGIRFQDLQLFYVHAPEPQNTRAAVRVLFSQNVTCSRVFFADCPVAMYMDNKALQCGLFDCTIQYSHGPDNAIAVTMGGSENYVADCVFRQGTDGNPPAADAPKGCTAISIAPHGGGIYVTDTQLADFDYGILIPGSNSENLTHACISNVHCTNGVNAVWIAPATGAFVWQVAFANCVFERTAPSAPTTTTPGVYVDVSGGGTISDIFFNNCMAHDWAGAGLDINGGRDIVITGGRYGSNGSYNPSGSTIGGITVTGRAARVLIVGADCSGSILPYSSQPQTPTPTAQPYGISVKANVIDMQVRACDLTGNASGALYVSNAGTDLEVTDCRGYNDQTPVLNGNSAPGLSNPLSASTCSTPYFGPSSVAFSNPLTQPLTVTVNGTTGFIMNFGDFYLSRPTDPVAFSGQPSKFAWIGK